MAGPTAPRNLLNLQAVRKSFGREPILDEVSLGVAEGERIGVVGRNGGGKSTLLRVLAGAEPVDAGRVSRANHLRLGLLSQVGQLDAEITVGEYVIGNRAEHSWASEPLSRQVLSALLGGYDTAVLGRTIGALSGGERRRVQLAKLLIQDLDLLLLDEPTNHLDVEAVAWLAQHLRERRSLSVVVVTHDRWFLDEVGDRMWETVDGGVEEYEGGYSAFVLAKAERVRQASVEQQRRNNLIRKELAWLRRGPPARTSKPKFRIDAANQLIANEPPARSEVELLAFAGSRLGKTVFEAHDVSLTLGERHLFDRLTWNVGPGDRIGIVGVNGAGKTSLVRLLLGLQGPTSGRIVRGVTVKPAYLSQHLEELNPQWRVLEAVEKVAQRVELGKGRELTATQLCERLGFVGDAQWTPVADLSGGERRRLQLTRLLMAGPNVLVLDEPTNDFDVETLTALEDLLDSFGGTLLVISHDRYFIERVCDRMIGLLGDAGVRDLPSGIDEFLDLRREARREAASDRREVPSAGAATTQSAADDRLRRKELARLERQLDKLATRESELHAAMAEHAADHVKAATLHEELNTLAARKAELEHDWLAAAE
ncbi:MAG TPA: ABC-F family ATP-binding cassette domain-containing protein [Actinomycetes bacterium]|nr:ABC-F family ATP-binding cassette domain-containing protein [Actinomycetes bacterium]